MTRQELEHIIRAATDVTNQNELIIIGRDSFYMQILSSGGSTSPAGLAAGLREVPVFA